MSTKVKVRMQLARETKGTFMFKELDDHERPVENISKTKIGTIYVRKTTFDGVAPDKIDVTVEAVEAVE